MSAIDTAYLKRIERLTEHRDKLKIDLKRANGKLKAVKGLLDRNRLYGMVSCAALDAVLNGNANELDGEN